MSQKYCILNLLNIEDKNNFIKVLKKIAFGFKSFRRFKARIMICKNLLHMKRADA